MLSSSKKNIWIFAPLFGILLYILLYVIATLFYPGGNQVNKNSKGFSWTQNYWCNLLNENAINGQHNSARPIALTAMLVLCISLATFWYIFPKQIFKKKSNKLIIQISGFISVTIGIFLFTVFHDYIINIATGFGLIALTGTFIGLYKIKWFNLFWMGLFTIILIAVNNLLYYNPKLIWYLPVVQKITFAYFLLWIGLIDFRLYKQSISILI